MTFLKEFLKDLAKQCRLALVILIIIIMHQPVAVLAGDPIKVYCQYDFKVGEVYVDVSDRVVMRGKLQRKTTKDYGAYKCEEWAGATAMLNFDNYQYDDYSLPEKDSMIRLSFRSKFDKSGGYTGSLNLSENMDIKPLGNQQHGKRVIFSFDIEKF